MNAVTSTGLPRSEGSLTTQTDGTNLAFDPLVFGESFSDRVSSLLMAVVIGALVVVGWLFLIYKTNQGYAARVTSPLQIVEVFGGGGGSPEGNRGETEKVDVPGGDPAAAASNNEETAADFEQPSVQETPAALLDAAAEAGQSLAEVDLSDVIPGGGVSSGKRASKLGTGGPGLGLGPGDGGVPADQRWSIVYNPGQTPEEYARQLDALGVELAVVSGKDQLTYVSRFSDATPTKRYGSGQGDNRLYFLWQGRGRKASDVTLLRKAGIDVGEGVVMQFYPKSVEDQLAQLEVRYRGRSPAEIRFTRFSVVPKANGYGFAVLAQEPLR
ncbi:MAG: hypothetical protein NVSMB9_03260 [Isosphaeraceae bacterium]